MVPGNSKHVISVYSVNELLYRTLTYITGSSNPQSLAREPQAEMNHHPPQ